MWSGATFREKTCSGAEPPRGRSVRVTSGRMPPHAPPNLSGGALILCGHRQGWKVAFSATFFFVQAHGAWRAAESPAIDSHLWPVGYAPFAIRPGFPDR